MGSKDVYYSYDVDTGEVVAKSRFNDDKTIDRWEGINKNGYSHDIYHDSEEFAGQGKGSVYTRSIGEKPEKQWQDRDHVFDNNSPNANNDKMAQARAQYMQDNPKQDQQTNNTDMTQATNQYTQDNPVSTQQQASSVQGNEEASNGIGSNSAGETTASSDDKAVDSDDTVDDDDDAVGDDYGDDDGDCE